MIYFLVAALTIISTYVHSIGGKSDYYSSKWWMLLTACAIFLGYEIWKKYHWSAGLFFGYALVNAVNVFMNYSNQYKNFSHINKLTIIAYTAIGVVSYVLVYMVVDRIKRKDYVILENFLAVVCIIDSLYVIIQLANGNSWITRGGLWSNVSVNGTFISLLIPFLFSSRFRYFIPIAVVACLVTKSSVSVGTLAVVLGTYSFLSFKKNPWGRYLISFLIMCGIFLVGFKYDQNLLSDSHRFKHQGAHIAQWYETSYYRDIKVGKDTVREIIPKQETTRTKWGRYIFGWGAGTFPFHGVLSQRVYSLEWIGLAQWAHSDWLQILLELGLIGLLLSINLFFWCLWYSRKDKVLFSQIMCFGASMVFLYPVHYPLHAFLMMYFIKKSLDYSQMATKIAIGKWYTT